MLINLPTHTTDKGNLTVLQEILPFEIKRIYWNYKNYVNTRFNLNEHKLLINEFYKKDFEKLPAEIKNKCSNYNYLN